MGNEPASKAVAWALAICVLAAALEGLVSGTNVEEYLAGLTMPPVSPPLWMWYAIGAGYYIMCFVLLYRVIHHGRRGRWRNTSLGLALLLMVSNAAWNWAFFEIQDPSLGLLLLVPYNAVAMALLVTTARVDRVALLAVVPYAAYLIYADYWAHGVWRLNP